MLLQPCNPVLLQAIPLLTRMLTFIILFVGPLTKAKKLEQYFLTLAKLLIGSGIRVFYSNCNLLVSPVLFWNGLQTIFLRESSVLFFQVCLQTGQLLKQAYPKALSWGRYSF